MFTTQRSNLPVWRFATESLRKRGKAYELGSEARSTSGCDGGHLLSTAVRTRKWEKNYIN